MKKLYKVDEFCILKNQQFFDIDLSILTLLYQPIIGAKAINLYITMLADAPLYKDKQTVSKHSRLLSILSSSSSSFTINDFMQARSTLEAFKLLKTLFKSNSSFNQYIYMLYPPLSAASFLKNGSLSTLLEANLNKTDFKKTISLFEKNTRSSKEFVDISAKFNEIYKVKPIKKGQMISFQLEDRKKKNNFNIYYTHIKKSLKIMDNKISIPRCSKNFTDYLTKINLILNLPNESIAYHLLVLSQEINSEKLTLNDITTYFDRMISDVNGQEKQKELVYQMHDNTKKANGFWQLINDFESQSVADFYLWAFNKQMSSEITSALNEIMLNFELQPGVINAILFYIYSNKKIFSIQYVKKIAHSIYILSKEESQYKWNTVLAYAQIINYSQKKPTTNVKNK